MCSGCLNAMVLVPSLQDPRAEQLMDDLEKKDQEIEKLKTTISQWEVSVAALKIFKRATCHSHVFT